MPTAIEQARQVIDQFEVVLALPANDDRQKQNQENAFTDLEMPALMALAKCGVAICEAIVDIATSLAVLADRR